MGTDVKSQSFFGNILVLRLFAKPYKERPKNAFLSPPQHILRCKKGKVGMRKLKSLMSYVRNRQVSHPMSVVGGTVVKNP